MASWCATLGAMADRILLVYNADSGRLNALFDSALKALGAGACTLCDLTHGLAGERPEWRALKCGLGLPVEGLHRDELWPEIAALVDGRLPCIVVERDASLSIAVTREELAACRGSQTAFAELVQRRVGGAG